VSLKIENLLSITEPNFVLLYAYKKHVLDKMREGGVVLMV